VVFGLRGTAGNSAHRTKQTAKHTGQSKQQTGYSRQIRAHPGFQICVVISGYRQQTAGNRSGGPRRRASPSRASSRRRGKDRRKNASGDADVSERSPKAEWKHLAIRGSAARRVGSWFREREGPKEANGRVKKRKDIRPSNIRGRVGGSSRFE
jgi:hypothetical protein